MVIPRNYGRMGNYLFQVAAAIGYARRHGIEFTVPTTTNDSKNNPIYLQHLAHPRFDPKLPEVRVCERGHAYQEIPFKEEWRKSNIVLDGYWQSEKYFKEFRPDIIMLFKYEWRPQPNCVSVHVRRGDYLNLTHKHPAVPKEWYDAAMARFPGFSFMFFSDDLNYCRATWGHRKDCFFSGNTSEEADLQQMSGCEHHISSASTFSWWGAWLNQNAHKRIIIPRNWFTPQEEQKCNTKDIVPAEWERM